MLVSVIVPVYNSEKYISRLIDSVLNQTYSNIELILVDDGSTDETLKILKQYESENVHVFTKPNEGVGKTRKFGYTHSKGDVIFFCDSDDYLPNKYVIEKIANIFNKNNADLLMFDALEISNNGSNVVNCFSRGKFDKGVYDLSSLSQCFLFGSLALKAFKRNLLTLDCFCDDCNFEDTYLTYKYLNNCNNFYYLNEPLYVIDMLINPSSLTKQKDVNKFIKTIDLCAKIYKESKLKESCTISAFNYYTYMISLLNKENWIEEDKLRLKQKMKILEKIFYSKLSYLESLEDEKNLNKYYNFKKSLVPQKFIIVEGIPTVGKSTLTDILNDQLNKNFIKTVWLHEEIENNFIKIKDNNIEYHLSVWQNFLDRVKNDENIYLIDSNFFKILHKISLEDVNLDKVVKAFYHFINNNKENIMLVLLKRKNIEKSFLSSFKYRGKFWEDHCLKNNSLNEICEKEEQYQKIYEHIYKNSNCKKFRIYTDDDNWDLYAKEILKNSSLNYLTSKTSKLDYSKYCGSYSCDNWNAEITIDNKNNLFISVFWSKIELCNISDNVFKLKRFPLLVEFNEDYLIFSGEHEWDMKGKKFLKQNMRSTQDLENN